MIGRISMSGFVVTHCNMSVRKIEPLLDNLKHSYFKGLLTWKNKDTYWRFCCCEHIGEFWLNSPKRFEIKNQFGYFAHWVEFTIVNNVALQFKGRVSTDIFGGKWRGTPGKYPTFVNYLREHRVCLRESPEQEQQFQEFVQRELSRAPIEFQYE